MNTCERCGKSLSNQIAIRCKPCNRNHYNDLQRERTRRAAEETRAFRKRYKPYLSREDLHWDDGNGGSLCGFEGLIAPTLALVGCRVCFRLLCQNTDGGGYSRQSSLADADPGTDTYGIRRMKTYHSDYSSWEYDGAAD